jgi:DNA-binding winged helix-turn-helix (wHTH) protein/tetratricopeptide (TPR) repeat protein
VHYFFGRFEVDTERFQLRCEGEGIRLEPKVFDVLHYLVRQRERIVSKTELLESVWDAEHVSHSVVGKCICLIRDALGQEQATNTPIATVRGRGYRFVAPVRELASDGSDTRTVLGLASPAGKPSPFVGRDERMRQLTDALAQAERGQGQLRVLVGEPGMGKTRVVEELADKALAAGVEVWIGRCSSGEGTPALWPWIQVLRACVARLGQARVRESMGAARFDLGAWVPGLVEPDEEPDSEVLESSAARFRAFDALTRLFVTMSESAPQLLVLEDVHWADNATLQALNFMVAEVGRRRVMILATTRPAPARTAAGREAAIDLMTRHPQFERIELSKLTPDDVRAYVEAALAEAACDIPWDKFYQRTEGTPFFVVEAVRRLREDPGGATSTESANGIVRQRLAPLTQGAREVLEVAALIGRGFDVPVLLRAQRAQPVELLEALDEAMAHGLIHRDPQRRDRFAFVHVMISDVIASDLDMTKRAGLHMSIGRALEGLLKTGASVDSGEIARHFLDALPHVEIERTVLHCERAAAERSRMHAHDDAASFLKEALRALAYDTRGDLVGRRPQLLLALGRAQHLAGRLGAAKSTFKQALDLARLEQRPCELAHAALGMRSCQMLRAVPDAQTDEALSEALMVLPDDERALRARVLSRLAAQRPTDSRRMLSARAAALAADLDEPSTQYDVLTSRLHVCQHPEELEQRLTLADEVIALATERHCPEWAFEGFLARYDVNMRLLRVREAERALCACTDLAVKIGHPTLHLEARRIRLQHALGQGAEERLWTEIADVQQAAERLQLPFATFHARAQQFWWLRDTGRLAAGVGDEAAVLREFPWAESSARSVHAVAAIELGHSDRARDEFDFYARTNFERVPRAENYLFVLCNLALISDALSEVESSAKLYGLLTPYSKQLAMTGTLLHVGPVAHYLGILAAALGNLEEARHHFEMALQASERLGSRSWLARTSAAASRLGERRAALEALPVRQKQVGARTPSA